MVKRKQVPTGFLLNTLDYQVCRQLPDDMNCKLWKMLWVKLDYMIGCRIKKSIKSYND